MTFKVTGKSNEGGAAFHCKLSFFFINFLCLIFGENYEHSSTDMLCWPQASSLCSCWMKPITTKRKIAWMCITVIMRLRDDRIFAASTPSYPLILCNRLKLNTWRQKVHTAAAADVVYNVIHSMKILIWPMNQTHWKLIFFPLLFIQMKFFYVLCIGNKLFWNEGKEAQTITTRKR